VLTQADINAGHVANDALATATLRSGRSLPPQHGTTDTPLTPYSAISVVKNADTTGVHNPARVGDKILYSAVVSDTGDTTLTDVTATDQTFGSIKFVAPAVSGWPSGVVGTLEPGESVSFTAAAPYLVTQADISAGHVSNVALASGKSPDGSAVSSGPGSRNVVLAEAPPPPVSPNSNGTPTAVNAGYAGNGASGSTWATLIGGLAGVLGMSILLGLFIAALRREQENEGGRHSA
jgi:hypothetical protein